MCDNIANFIQSQELKRAALTFIASKIPEESIEDLRDSFVRIDRNGDGKLTLKELKEGLKYLNIKLD